MSPKRLLHKSSITALDIKRRHPRYLTFDTDREYANLANEIYNLVYEELLFMEDEQIRNASISLALYFEDIHSGLHLFDTFVKMYQKMFGCYLPFYNTSGADDLYASFDAMRFMIWHSCMAERDGRILNPGNKGLENLADELLCFWDTKKTTISPNEELADYLYSEETQADANQIKNVLVWLSRYCPLGRWFTNPLDEKDTEELKGLMPDLDKGTLTYATDCYALCEQRTWPLSVAPQHVYAEMIRIDMDDPYDEVAAAIDNMMFKPFGICEVVHCTGRELCLRDFLGNTFRVGLTDFFGDAKKLAQKHTHMLGAFICLEGDWHLNGPCAWVKPSKKQVDEYIENLRKAHHYMHDYQGQYDDFIQEHGGERLYFFSGAQEYGRWLQEELQLEYDEMPLPDKYRNQPMAVFIEDNGQMTSCFRVQAIKHPANPHYNLHHSFEDGLHLVGTRTCCTSGLMLHFIKHNLLPDASLNDARGREYGHALLQDNLEFVARCLRRDITTDDAIRQRTLRALKKESDDMAERYATKYSYDDFVSLIAAEKVIRSKANKEWQVVKADNITTIVRDVSRKLDYEISTRDLYEAHLSLAPEQIQVAALVPFVGKEKAPASSALLYNIVGKGQFNNNLRKFVNELMENGGFEKLEQLIQSGK